MFRISTCSCIKPSCPISTHFKPNIMSFSRNFSHATVASCSGLLSSVVDACVVGDMFLKSWLLLGVQVAC